MKELTINMSDIDSLEEYLSRSGDNGSLNTASLSNIFTSWMDMSLKTKGFNDFTSLKNEDEDFKRFKNHLSENLYLILLLTKKLDLTEEELLLDGLITHPEYKYRMSSYTGKTLLVSKV